MKASSIGGYDSIHLLAPEFMHQSMIQTDQPAGREWLVREDKGTDFFGSKRDRKDSPILKPISHASSQVFEHFFSTPLEFDHTEQPPHAKFSIYGETQEQDI